MLCTAFDCKFQNGCVCLGCSGWGPMIQDHSDHGASKEPINNSGFINRWILVQSGFINRWILDWVNSSTDEFLSRVDSSTDEFLSRVDSSTDEFLTEWIHQPMNSWLSEFINRWILVQSGFVKRRILTVQSEFINRWILFQSEFIGSFPEWIHWDISKEFTLSFFLCENYTWVDRPE